uniref:C2H2-type domain-containing protein n=1 Tax=Rhabditophanes sp. KR3021 TaxID=114890 RepID=A0AC35U431_9BILA
MSGNDSGQQQGVSQPLNTFNGQQQQMVILQAPVGQGGKFNQGTSGTGAPINLQRIENGNFINSNGMTQCFYLLRPANGGSGYSNVVAMNPNQFGSISMPGNGPSVVKHDVDGQRQQVQFQANPVMIHAQPKIISNAPPATIIIQQPQQQIMKTERAGSMHNQNGNNAENGGEDNSSVVKSESRESTRITLGNLQFEQDPNDPQKWIVIQEGNNSAETAVQPEQQQPRTPPQQQLSSPGNQQITITNNFAPPFKSDSFSNDNSGCDSPFDDNSYTANTSNFAAQGASSNGGGVIKRSSAKRQPCECENCTNNHGVSREQKVKGHICSICKKSYGKTSHLRAHIRGHNNERPFACDHQNCPKAFTRSDELQRHRRIHSNVKNFVCSVCSKGFIRSDHLSKHLKTHSKKIELDMLSSTNSPTDN